MNVEPLAFHIICIHLLTSIVVPGRMVIIIAHTVLLTLNLTVSYICNLFLCRFMNIALSADENWTNLNGNCFVNKSVAKNQLTLCVVGPYDQHAVRGPGPHSYFGLSAHDYEQCEESGLVLTIAGDNSLLF